MKPRRQARNVLQPVRNSVGDNSNAGDTSFGDLRALRQTLSAADKAPSSSYPRAPADTAHSDLVKPSPRSYPCAPSSTAKIAMRTDTSDWASKASKTSSHASGPPPTQSHVSDPGPVTKDSRSILAALTSHAAAAAEVREREARMERPSTGLLPTLPPPSLRLAAKSKLPSATVASAVEAAVVPPNEMNTVRLSSVPAEMTYDRLRDLVSPFGEVVDVHFDSGKTAEVVYANTVDAAEAAYFLDDAALEGESGGSALGAELVGRDDGALLTVAGLAPSVTEAMLVKAFGVLVPGRVAATIKRDSWSGEATLEFESDADASLALRRGQGMLVEGGEVRVERAERSAVLCVSDLADGVSVDDLNEVFGLHGGVIEEETVFVLRSYAFVRYVSRGSAESAKRTLDKTSLRGTMNVRYAVLSLTDAGDIYRFYFASYGQEAEQQKSIVHVQFHSQLKQPPAALKEFLHSAFSKYGLCSVDIPQRKSGGWRRTAFVRFDEEPVLAAMAATSAVQNVTSVLSDDGSLIRVMCQFARELIPRLSSVHHPKGRDPRANGKLFGGQGGSASRRDMSLDDDDDHVAVTIQSPSLHPQASNEAACLSHERKHGGTFGAARRHGSSQYSVAGHHFQSAAHAMGRHGDADEMGSLGCRNEQQSMLAMPVVMTNMGGYFAGREMPPSFQVPFAPQMFATQSFGQQYPTAGVYGAQTGGGHHGLYVPVISPRLSPMRMESIGIESIQVDIQAEKQPL